MLLITVTTSARLTAIAAPRRAEVHGQCRLPSPVTTGEGPGVRAGAQLCKTRLRPDVTARYRHHMATRYLPAVATNLDSHHLRAARPPHDPLPAHQSTPAFGPDRPVTPVLPRHRSPRPNAGGGAACVGTPLLIGEGPGERSAGPRVRATMPERDAIQSNPSESARVSIFAPGEPDYIQRRKTIRSNRTADGGPP
jgi:hypothetical protein